MKKFTLLFLAVISVYNSQAQDLEKYDLTYWNYRDRFKKFFVKIGKDEGESLPATASVPGCALGFFGIHPYIFDLEGMTAVCPALAGVSTGEQINQQGL